MFTSAHSACVAGSCWAWSRKKRWHDWYAGCHSNMSKDGSPANAGGAGGCSWSLALLKDGIRGGWAPNGPFA